MNFKTFDGAKVSAFLGVPYAKPPIGSRRFKMAEMIDRWSGELEARTLAKTCYLTIDSAFPQFPGAEMWNPPGVRCFLLEAVLTGLMYNTIKNALSWVSQKNQEKNYRQFRKTV